MCVEQARHAAEGQTRDVVGDVADDGDSLDGNRKRHILDLVVEVLCGYEQNTTYL